MNQKQTLIIGFTLMALGVALGAFGAHAWKPSLVATGRFETYETGIRYLMIHAIVVIIMGNMLDNFPALKLSIYFLLAGILLFSGSLIILALSNTGMWGAVAPFGGTAFILGWLSAAWAVWKG